MAPSKRPDPRPNVGATPGTYFLSLTVENIRCFGPPQTLDLSDGQGGHAPWTIILGENGLGKTTLLTCLACIGDTGQRSADWDWFYRWKKLVRSRSSRFEARAFFIDPTSSRSNPQVSISVQESSFEIAGSSPSLVSFHYGARRRMPQRQVGPAMMCGRAFFWMMILHSATRKTGS
jgi:hypothetical protein